MLTQGKKRAERSWLGEVSSVVLQQSLRDLESAYRAFFESRSGKRKGPPVGAPTFKSRKDKRQSVRFTANARWKITETGRLILQIDQPLKPASSTGRRSRSPSGRSTPRSTTTCG